MLSQPYCVVFLAAQDTMLGVDSIGILFVYDFWEEKRDKTILLCP